MRIHDLLREVMEGRILGKKGPGRPRTRMLNKLVENKTYGAMNIGPSFQKWKFWTPWTGRTNT